MPWKGEPRYVTIERFRWARVPLGTDPYVAVRLCRAHGMIADRNTDCRIDGPLIDPANLGAPLDTASV
ncbi:MAG TPA: hypothetical protein VNU68_07235 [Verrucomicrobiae bacterium]|nr:hypothetical protein [Verrucomicrobiae bacterium]